MRKKSACMTLTARERWRSGVSRSIEGETCKKQKKKQSKKQKKNSSQVWDGITLSLKMDVPPSPVLEGKEALESGE